MSGFRWTGDDAQPTTAADDAELLELRGEYDGEQSLVVHYEAFETTFRASLSPVADGEALEITSLSEVEEVRGEPIGEYDLSTELPRVPPVVRRSVQRPVQVPNNE